MDNLYLTLPEASALVHRGIIAVFAGSEDALRGLPPGNWIGGTTPYFMTGAGGVIDSERVFCTVFSEAAECRTVAFDVAGLPGLAKPRFSNGFSYVLMPAFSAVHNIFAVEGPAYPELCDQPVMGWVTGALLAELGTRTPKVFDGLTGAVYEDRAVIMYVRLPTGYAADLDIINLFTQGDGPDILFPQDGFSAGACTVDGKPANIAQYLSSPGIDTKLPLVADYAGAQVNVAAHQIDKVASTATFYAPVMAGQVYRLARPIKDYALAYAAGAGSARDCSKMAACNCILNFLYAELEGKTTGGFVGPVTFGEIAYVLLNQTLVRLHVAASATPIRAKALQDAL